MIGKTLYMFYQVSSSLLTVQFEEYTTKPKEQLAIKEAEFQNDQALFPSKERDSNDKLFWHKHPAACQLLHDDVKDGIGSMKPAELYKTLPEYHEFELASFR
jgi:hypothetical protein